VPAPGPFERVPLPDLPPGRLTAGRLAPALREWAESEPIRALAAASGWEWPRTADTTDLLAQLAELSGDWDFRSRAGNAERLQTEIAAVYVNGRIVSEDLIGAAAAALQLVDAAPSSPQRFTHVAVLAGKVSACVNRTALAASLLREGLCADSVTVLGGHRELFGGEPDLARGRGLGTLFDEADVVLAAARHSFQLGEPEQTEESSPQPASWSRSLWGESARYRWKGLDVIIAPSGEPGVRRADTADQLHYWADLTGLGPEDRVLLLTTQIYVPYQQLTALRLLGLNRACSVYCQGVDATRAVIPMKKFTGCDYLQEIRSALLSASKLMAEAQSAGS
jgi:hypothetical protein